MYFKKFVEDRKTLAAHGVHFVGTPKIDETVKKALAYTPEECDNRMQDILDDLCSYDGPLYRGSDDFIYAVEFVCVGDYLLPACWWKVEKGV